MRFEDKVKKDLQNAIGNDKEPNKDLYLKVISNQSLTKKKKFNFKPLLMALSICVIILIVGLSLIKPSPNFDNTYNAIIQIDVNPSIEMIVNEKNEVLAVNGLNDEGKMIIYNEKIVGKSLENALQTIINLEISLGYLTKNNDNEITYTISAKNENIVKKIQTNTKDITNNVLNAKNIAVSINNKIGKSKEELIETITKLDPTINLENVNNYDELVNLIKANHLEMVDFVNIKLEEYYRQFLNYEIVLQEKNLIQDAIKAKNELYQEIYTSYSAVIKELNDTYTLIQQNYYDCFINPESEYQKSLIELVNLKEELLIQQHLVDNMSEDDLKIIIEKAKLTKLKAQYELSEAALSSIEITAQKSYDLVIKTFNTILDSLSIIEKNLPTEISTINFKITYDTTEKINNFKNDLITKFMTKYKNDIENAKNAIINRKTNIIASLNQTKKI